MDYMKFVEHHRATEADITIGCLPCDEERAADFGLMKIDGDGRIVVRPWLPAYSPAQRSSRVAALAPQCKPPHAAAAAAATAAVQCWRVPSKARPALQLPGATAGQPCCALASCA